jgi:hypothetical protein
VAEIKVTALAVFSVSYKPTERPQAVFQINASQEYTQWTTLLKVCFIYLNTWLRIDKNRTSWQPYAGFIQGVVK